MSAASWLEGREAQRLTGLSESLELLNDSFGLVLESGDECRQEVDSLQQIRSGVDAVHNRSATSVGTLEEIMTNLSGLLTSSR